jgi:hypothetical protein
MTTSSDNHPVSGNPFALMMDPEAVVQAIERSERLARLRSRVCRPLDKPVLDRTLEARPRRMRLVPGDEAEDLA